MSNHTKRRKATIAKIARAVWSRNEQREGRETVEAVLTAYDFGSRKKVRQAAYWKYRLAHERAAHGATKRERNATVNDLVTRLTKARKTMAKLRAYVHALPGSF